MNPIAKYILNQRVGIKPFKVCFLPYKRAMWDSMRSVYSSLYLHCITRVCPVPYFVVKDGHIDMSEGMKCEKDKFDMLGVIDFNDFPNWNFDYVVIHNPYDDNNNLTYLHPMFHSDVLKERSKIVYIPYGSMDNPDMIFQKGIYNADVIFPNTKKESNYIISEYTKKGIDMSGKVIYLGSPKKDFITEVSSIPKWDLKIRNKVVLVCTSILPFMASPKRKMIQYWKKINELLSEKATVIFRPHPLMTETILSRFPDIYDDWTRILSFVERNALLSAYEDLSECFYYADYLVTDASSITEVWKATGKKFEIMD